MTYTAQDGYKIHKGNMNIPSPEEYSLNMSQKS